MPRARCVLSGARWVLPSVGSALVRPLSSCVCVSHTLPPRLSCSELPLTFHSALGISYRIRIVNDGAAGPGVRRGERDGEGLGSLPGATMTEHMGTEGLAGRPVGGDRACICAHKPLRPRHSPHIRRTREWPDVGCEAPRCLQAQRVQRSGMWTWVDTGKRSVQPRRELRTLAAPALGPRALQWPQHVALGTVVPGSVGERPPGITAAQPRSEASRNRRPCSTSPRLPDESRSPAWVPTEDRGPATNSGGRFRTEATGNGRCFQPSLSRRRRARREGAGNKQHQRGPT